MGNVALVLLMRVGLGRLRLALLARRASIVDDGDWLLLAQRLAYRLDISRPITLVARRSCLCAHDVGLVYPTVLLPADADAWTAERRTIVLLHELAHVERLDAFTQLVAQIATAIFWFNPLAWLAARAMRVDASSRAMIACSRAERVHLTTRRIFCKSRGPSRRGRTSPSRRSRWLAAAISRSASWRFSTRRPIVGPSRARA